MAALSLPPLSHPLSLFPRPPSLPLFPFPPCRPSLSLPVYINPNDLVSARSLIETQAEWPRGDTWRPSFHRANSKFLCMSPRKHRRTWRPFGVQGLFGAVFVHVRVCVYAVFVVHVRASSCVCVCPCTCVRMRACVCVRKSTRKYAGAYPIACAR